MSERLHALRRIAKVQAQMTRMAEWRLAGTERRLAELASRRETLDSFLLAGDVGRDLAALALRQTQNLGTTERRTAEERERDAAALLAARRMSQQVETTTAELARAERDIAERQDLERLMETWVAMRQDVRAGQNS